MFNTTVLNGFVTRTRFHIAIPHLNEINLPILPIIDYLTAKIFCFPLISRPKNSTADDKRKLIFLQAYRS